MLNNLLKVTKNVISKCVKPVLESAKKAFQPQINNLKKSTLGKVAAKILPVVNSPTVKSGFSQVQKALALPKVVAPAKKESAPPPQISTNNQAKQLSASSNSPAPQEENVKLLEQYKGTESSLLEDIIRGAVKSDAGHIIFKGDLDSPAMQGFFAMLRTVTSPGFKNTGLKAPYEELKAVIKDKFNEVGNDVYNAHIPIASNFIGAFTNSSDYKQQGPLPLESEKTNHLLAILHYSMYADKAGGTLNHADALTTYQNMVSNTNMASVIGANAGGALISGGAGMVDSIIETVLDPYEFQKNLLNLVVNSPVIIPTLLKEIEDYSKHYVYEASPQEKARVKGRIVFELASLAVLSAIGKASKGAETSQGVQKTEEMVKNGSKASALVDEGGVSITKTEDVLAANRGVGEVVEEGAKKGTGNAGKTGEAIEGTGKIKYDINGKYTGGRTQNELNALEYDPAKKAITNGSKNEAKIGLDLEEKGIIRQLERSPDPKAEFIDSITGKKYDVKSFESTPMGSDGVPITSPRKGAFKAENAMKNIVKEFERNGNDIVIIDKSKLLPEHVNELTNAIEGAGLSDKIIWWPE